MILKVSSGIDIPILGLIHTLFYPLFLFLPTFSPKDSYPLSSYGFHDDLDKDDLNERFKLRSLCWTLQQYIQLLLTPATGAHTLNTSAFSKLVCHLLYSVSMWFIIKSSHCPQTCWSPKHGTLLFSLIIPFKYITYTFLLPSSSQNLKTIFRYFNNFYIFSYKTIFYSGTRISCLKHTIWLFGTSKIFYSSFPLPCGESPIFLTGFDRLCLCSFI